MNRLPSAFKFLVSPFVVGLIITGIFAWGANRYYQSRHKASEELDAIESFVDQAHQKSIDFRLRQRGERAGSPQVAILAVDERAVTTVGRWPWPREVFAKAVDRAVKGGAKGIVFDVVFSEPSNQAAAEAFQEVSKKIALSQNIQDEFAKAIADRDSDLVLGKVLSEDSNSIVQGTFGQIVEEEKSKPHTETCYDMAFQLTSESENLGKKETPVLFVGEQPPQLPESLRTFYINQLQEVASVISESAGAKNSVENRDLKIRIASAQADFCSSWLDPKDDPTYAGISENWAAVADAEGESFKSKYPSFESWVKEFKSQSHLNSIPRVKSWSLNTPELLKLGEKFNTGFFNAFQDRDGTIRRSDLLLRAGLQRNSYLPSIALKGYLTAFNYNARAKMRYDQNTHRDVLDSLEVVDSKGQLQVSVPVDSSGRFVINYAGPQKMFPHVSLGDFLSDSDELGYDVREFNSESARWEVVHKVAKKSEFLKDKLFILGATAVGIYDLRVAPFEENYPGAEIHANILDNLIRKDFLVSHPDEDSYMLWVLLGIGIVLSASITYFGALYSFLLTGVFALLVAAVDKYLLFSSGIVVTVILPLGLILLLFLFLITYKYFTEERGKKELRKTFQKYVSPAIVSEILSDPAKIELGGRKAEVTMFFSDVRNFTSISEKLDPHALGTLLNRYLTPMTDLIFENRGTLDKYMGDAIMAFFGAPVSFRDHAKQACRCALLSLQKLRDLQEEFAKEGLPNIDIGIGLNTGEAVVGNMGSKIVQNYTVMGDSVNLASRLEGLTKYYGTRIVISEFTYAAVKDSFLCREIDWVRVHGKEQPVRIFELIAEGTTDTVTLQMLETFAAAYQLYHQRKWAPAVQGFEQVLSLKPEDTVSNIYIERCQQYMLEEPGETWDGVFSLKSK